MLTSRATAPPATGPLHRLLAIVVLVAGVAPVLAAQDRSSPLDFHGLRAAMTRAEADSAIARHGAALRCQPTMEPRLLACTAQATIAGDPVTVTISLVDGRVGILLVAARLTAGRVANWHAALIERYGEVAPERRPGQERFQWIRAGQMLRLTVRRDGGGLTASVSLLDGALLDGLPPP